MTLLSIDSSTSVCSAALTIGGEPVATRIMHNCSSHAGQLPLYVEELLAELKSKGLKPDGVVLSEGPGSYTGLRIAASLAKGLCYGMDIPLITLPTPLVLSASYAATHKVGNEWLCPMTDARRMEVYSAVYDENLQEQQAIAAVVVDENSYADVLEKHPIVFFGDGAMKCATTIQHANARFVADVVPEAQYMGLLAENGFGKRIEGKDIAYYDPFYLKEFVAAPSHVKGLK